MKVKFYLDTQKKTRHGDNPVYMYITFDNKRIRKPVPNVHASEKAWDDDKQKIKRPTKPDLFDEVKSFNNRLDFIKAQIAVIDQESFDRRIKLSEKYILERLNDESLVKTDQFDFFKTSAQYLESIRPVNLSTSHKVLGIYNVSHGSIMGTVADPKLIFAAALKANATGIILAHNHPSGNSQPSKADIGLTRKCKEIGELLDIKILDHMIITTEGYYSFADEGMI